MEQNPSSKADDLSTGRDFTPAVTVPGMEHGVTTNKLVRNFNDEPEHFSSQICLFLGQNVLNVIDTVMISAWKELKK